MRRFGFALAVALAAGPAMGNPLVDAIKSDGGMVCFTRSYDARWLKAHRGQTVREVRFAITADGTLRMSMAGRGQPIYVFGSCSWAAGDLNRGVANRILIATFAPTTGVACHMMTDVTGASAEEGGDFPVDWRDGRTIELHLNDYLAAWRSHDVRRAATWPDLAAGDRIFRLNRASPSACRALVSKFAPD